MAKASLGTGWWWAGLQLSGAVSSVARGLPTFPQVRCGIHTVPFLGHSLDHIQEKGIPGLVVAPGLEPLLHILEGREGQCTGEDSLASPVEGPGPLVEI